MGGRPLTSLLCLLLLRDRCVSEDGFRGYNSSQVVNNESTTVDESLDGMNVSLTYITFYMPRSDNNPFNTSADADDILQIDGIGAPDAFVKVPSLNGSLGSWDLLWENISGVLDQIWRFGSKHDGGFCSRFTLLC